MLNGRISGVVLMALALVSAVLIAGCGGGEETADATEKLTKAEFIKQAEAACQEAVDQREKQLEKLSKENDFTFQSASNKQLEEAITVAVLPGLKRQADGLAALGAPAGDEEQVEEIVASLEGVVEELENDPGVALEGNPLEETRKLAEAYGVKICARE